MATIPLVADVQYKYLFVTSFGRQFYDARPISPRGRHLADSLFGSHDCRNQRRQDEKEPLSLDELRRSGRCCRAPTAPRRSRCFRATRPRSFLRHNARDQAALILGLPAGERRSWMRLLAPDDAADLVQEAPAEDRDKLLALLDEPTRAR